MESIKQTLDRFPKSTPDRRTYEQGGYAPDETPEEHRAKNLYALGALALTHTFANIRPTVGLQPALDAFKAIASGQADFSLLLVYGGVGNGKSHLCEATVIDMYDRGLWVGRQRWSDVVRALKAHFSAHFLDSSGLHVPYERYFAELRARQRLIFDDVGSGSTLGSWEWGELEDIVDYRYERRLFTILTTNLDIKSFPDRILSRFRDKSRSRLVYNEAADQRPLLGGQTKNEGS